MDYAMILLAMALVCPKETIIPRAQFDPPHKGEWIMVNSIEKPDPIVRCADHGFGEKVTDCVLSDGYTLTDVINFMRAAMARTGQRQIEEHEEIEQYIESVHASDAANAALIRSLKRDLHEQSVAYREAAATMRGMLCADGHKEFCK